MKKLKKFKVKIALVLTVVDCLEIIVVSSTSAVHKHTTLTKLNVEIIACKFGCTHSRHRI